MVLYRDRRAESGVPEKRRNSCFSGSLLSALAKMISIAATDFHRFMESMLRVWQKD